MDRVSHPGLSKGSSAQDSSPERVTGSCRLVHPALPRPGSAGVPTAVKPQSCRETADGRVLGLEPLVLPRECPAWASPHPPFVLVKSFGLSVVLSWPVFSSGKMLNTHVA